MMWIYMLWLNLKGTVYRTTENVTPRLFNDCPMMFSCLSDDSPMILHSVFCTFLIHDSLFFLCPIPMSLLTTIQKHLGLEKTQAQSYKNPSGATSTSCGCQLLRGLVVQRGRSRGRVWGGCCKKKPSQDILKKTTYSWVVVSNIFYFHPYLGQISILTNIFQMGWNHQPDRVSNISYFPSLPTWVDDAIWLAHIFQWGWFNHQLEQSFLKTKHFQIYRILSWIGLRLRGIFTFYYGKSSLTHHLREYFYFFQAS